MVASPGGTPMSIVKDPGPIGAPSWTPDGANVMYTTGGGGGGGGGPINHDTIAPEIGAKLIFRATEGGRGGGGGGATFMVPAAGGAPKAMAAGGAGRGGGGGGGRGGGGGNWLDATHVLGTRTSNGGKTRTTEAIDINGGAPKMLHEETVEKFFSQVNATAAAISPDRKWLLYTTDTTGWDQIFVVPTAGGTPVQITKAIGEHWRATWSHDSKTIAWDANTADKPGTRHIEFATIGDDPSKATIVTVTSGSGTNTSAQWSPDDKRILYQHTDYQNSADLYVADAAANAKPTRLTSSMPSSIDKSALVAPQLIRYPGPDGKSVPAWLFVPKNLDRTKKHAAIVWIHPDGVNMNYDGWHTDRNEAVYYEIHQYFLQQGYVVIAPDYRGSIGYGRDWRNDVYMDVGGNDAKDARMAATYLKTLGYVDARSHRRVGLELRRLLHAARDYAGADVVPGGRRRGRRRGLRAVLRGSVPRRLDDEPHRHAGRASGRLRESGADVTRGSDQVSALDPARHRGRERAVHPLGAARGSSDEGRQGRPRHVHGLSGRVPLLRSRVRGPRRMAPCR